MSRKGLRPHLWKVQGEIPHQQYISWQRARAQANFRGEIWLLTFEQYQQIWQPYWSMKGRGKNDMCLTREDPTGAWEPSNVTVMHRLDHLRRQALYKQLARS